MSLRVRFAKDDLFVESTGAQLAVDRIFVRCPRPPPVGSEVFLRLYVAGLAGDEQLTGIVCSIAPSGSEPGFEAELVGAQAIARPAAPAHSGPLRVRARISTAREFAEQHANGLGSGTLRVPMAVPPPAGTLVELSLELPDGGPPATCEAVVSRSTLDAGGVSGQAEIKCLGSDTEFHHRLEACLAWLALQLPGG